MSNNYRLLKYLAAFVCMGPVSVSVFAQPPENFDRRVETVRQNAGVHHEDRPNDRRFQLRLARPAVPAGRGKQVTGWRASTDRKTF